MVAFSITVSVPIEKGAFPLPSSHSFRHPAPHYAWLAWCCQRTPLVKEYRQHARYTRANEKLK